MENIVVNLENVRTRIVEAAERVGRHPDSVTLVAVTKTVTPLEVMELYRLGVRNFGENRVADGLTRKNALAAPDAVWHMIGHLQRNKARDALEGGYACVHSVESAKLVDVLQQEAEKLGMTLPILLEANISGEESKYGAAADDVLALLQAALAKPNLQVRGLMTMAPLTDNPENARPFFRGLRLLRDRLQDATGAALPDLSMGMTGDFEVAVEEGSTLVRVGTALFR